MNWAEFEPRALNSDPHWWKNAAIYQIYPRSFADSNGDGIGDLRGIISKIGYLQRLGVNAVWLSPFYPSALADGGYDVDDYRDVDPRIGTLADFDELVEALHAAGIHIIVDIVPNHSSDRHELFRAAVAAGRGAPERDLYIFRDGRGENGELPPNTWPAMFGGIMWDRVQEPDGSLGQWYFHTFAKEQPDFNWENPRVHEEFARTLRFWADRGVDGFRIDVAHGLAKNLDPAYDAIRDIRIVFDDFHDGQHPLWDRDEVHDIYREWRKIFNEYSPPRFAVAEAWVPAHRRPAYASENELGQSFNFDLVKAPFDARSFKNVVKSTIDATLHGSSATWVLSNHDVIRHATRYARGGQPSDPQEAIDALDWLNSGAEESLLDRENGSEKARAATLFMLGLPGSAYLYQGEELGLHEYGDMPDDSRQDPTFARTHGKEKGRDGCRVPLPWKASGSGFGFDEKAHEPGYMPHLPQPQWFAQMSVESQEKTDDSFLTFYQNALALRARIQEMTEFSWLTPAHMEDACLAYTRSFSAQNESGQENALNAVIVITNFSDTPVRISECIKSEAGVNTAYANAGNVHEDAAKTEDGLLLASSEEARRAAARAVVAPRSTLWLKQAE